MSDKNKKQTKTSISQAQSIEEIGDFWDTHSVADYWDEMAEVDFEVTALRRHRVTLAPEVYGRLEQEARKMGILPETLVNVWLAERLQEVG